jgi:hypothetical protein
MFTGFKYSAVIQITELLPDFLQSIITSYLCLSILFNSRKSRCLRFYVIRAILNQFMYSERSAR